MISSVTDECFITMVDALTMLQPDENVAELYQKVRTWNILPTFHPLCIHCVVHSYAIAGGNSTAVLR